MIAITRTIETTHKHSVGRMKNFLVLNLVAHKVAIKRSRDTKLVSSALLYKYPHALGVISCSKLSTRNCVRRPLV